MANVRSTSPSQLTICPVHVGSSGTCCTTKKHESWPPSGILDEESVEGDTVSYGYDSGGRLTTMGAMTATYDPTSARLDTTTLGNVTTTVSYDGFGDVSGVLYEAANTAFYEVTYTRDGFGRVETKTETRPGSTSLRCYEYDGSDRLAAV